MSREIEFRAWLKDEKKMVKVSELRDIDTNIRSDQNVIYFDFEKQEYCNKGFDEIEFIGVCTDICVVSNALILKSLCPESTFIVDAACCAGSTPDNHNAALKVMKSCHMEIQNWQEEMKPAEPIRDTYVGYWITCPNCGYDLSSSNKTEAILSFGLKDSVIVTSDETTEISYSQRSTPLIRNMQHLQNLFLL